MKTLNQKIVRILLNHCETLEQHGRLIQVIPNGDIEDIANEIEQQVISVDLADVGKPWSEMKDGDEMILRCRKVKGKFELCSE